MTTPDALFLAAFALCCVLVVARLVRLVRGG